MKLKTDDIPAHLNDSADRVERVCEMISELKLEYGEDERLMSACITQLRMELAVLRNLDADAVTGARLANRKTVRAWDDYAGSED